MLLIFLAMMEKHRDLRRSHKSEPSSATVFRNAHQSPETRA
jgi:hypothetical protein